MTDGRSIAGRKADRNKNPADWYATPPEATAPLLDTVQFDGTILEPCSGDGAISKMLERKFGTVVSSDLMEEGYGQGNVDLFSYPKGSFDNVITNPPYNIADEVAFHLCDVARKKVALLLKLTFLESEKRQKLFRETPLSEVLVFTKRVTMWPFHQDKPANSGTIAFAWFIWDHEHVGRPHVGWIQPATKNDLVQQMEIVDI